MFQKATLTPRKQTTFEISRLVTGLVTEDGTNDAAIGKKLETEQLVTLGFV
jgi:hypothetical protein